MEIIFFDGFYSNDVPDSMPDYILGKGSMDIEKLTAFLEENQKYAINGYLDYTVKRSKGGKRYVELDLYRFNNPRPESSQTHENDPTRQENEKDDSDVDAEKIPF